MTETELEHLTERVADALQANPMIIHFAIDAASLSMLISNLQLAFRHPANNGTARQSMEILTRRLIEQLDPAHGDVYRLLMMGFDEAVENTFEEFIDG